MAIARPAGIREAGEEIHIRKIGLYDLAVSLSQGWDDFLAKRGDLVFIGLIYPAAVLLAGIYALNLIDANVDAHLSGFNISDDLALKFEPNVGTFAASGSSMGLTMKLQFK